MAQPMPGSSAATGRSPRTCWRWPTATPNFSASAGPPTRAPSWSGARGMAQTLDDVLAPDTGQHPAGAGRDGRAARGRQICPDLGWRREAAEQAARFTESCEKEDPRPEARPAVTTPTPVTPIDAAPDDVDDRLVRPPSTSAALLDDLGATSATCVDTAAAAGRAGPRLVAARHRVPRRRRATSRSAAAVVTPSTTEQVAARAGDLLLEALVPVPAAAGRSSVCGGSIPVAGHRARPDRTRRPRAGRRGVAHRRRAPARSAPDLETALGEVGDSYTLGHWPQSMDLSTVGGWLACRGAGQYSNRYGKIEDMVIGLEVVLADGRIVRTEGKGPRAATGPNLTQLFVGSEGTLGIITEARRIHPAGPGAPRLRLQDVRRWPRGVPPLCAGAPRRRPPALRRDRVRAELRPGRRTSLIVLDEADPDVLAGSVAVVDRGAARPLSRSHSVNA